MLTFESVLMYEYINLLMFEYKIDTSLEVQVVPALCFIGLNFVEKE